MTNPTKVTWTDPTLNTDGTPIAATEITGYTIGVRDTSSPGSAGGTYPYTFTAPSTVNTELLSVLTPVLPTGKPLALAVQALTANGNSAWSTEQTFTLTGVPNPPTGVSVS